MACEHCTDPDGLPLGFLLATTAAIVYPSAYAIGYGLIDLLALITLTPWRRGTRG